MIVVEPGSGKTMGIAEQHLIFLKELTDHDGLSAYEHPFGLCLITAEWGKFSTLK